MLNRMIQQNGQARSESSLDRLTTGDSLASDLEAFIVDCSVIRELADGTILDYTKSLGDFVRFMTGLGVLQASAITPRHIQLYLVWKRKTCNKVSVAHYYRDVRCFCNWLAAEPQKIIERSPMIGWKAPKADKPLIRPFTEAQLKALLFLCDDSFLGRRNRALILVMTDTGLRKAELARMQLSDVEIEQGLITVMGKGQKERYVRIGKRAQRAVLLYGRMRKDSLPCLWVTGERMPQKRTPLTGEGIYQMIKKLGKRAALTGVRCSPHTFRHTAATMALEIGAAQNNGAIERQVKEMLGHSTNAMMSIYTATLRSRWAAEGHKKFSPVDNLKGI